MRDERSRLACTTELASVCSPRRELGWSIGFILLATTLVFAPVLMDPSRAVQEDMAYYFQGVQSAAQEQISAGQWPAWNPYEKAGCRLMADPVTAICCPGSLAYRFLAFPTATVVTWFVHYALTAWLTAYLAVLGLGVRWWAGSVGGIVFAFGGFCLGHCNHLNFVLAYPWLVLILLVVLKLHAAEQGWQRWWILGVLSLACPILCGGIPILALMGVERGRS